MAKNECVDINTEQNSHMNILIICQFKSELYIKLKLHLELWGLILAELFNRIHLYNYLIFL